MYFSECTLPDRVLLFFSNRSLLDEECLKILFSRYEVATHGLLDGFLIFAAVCIVKFPLYVFALNSAGFATLGSQFIASSLLSLASYPIVFGLGAKFCASMGLSVAYSYALFFPATMMLEFLIVGLGMQASLMRSLVFSFLANYMAARYVNTLMDIVRPFLDSLLGR